VSPERYFQSELYSVLPETDLLHKLELQFLRCLSCECCHGNVDECAGQTCQILGQCYCYSQLEQEERGLEEQHDDRLIQALIRDIERDYANWSYLDH
jgi:hypothetical protein